MKFSIVTVCYNSSSTIENTLRSVELASNQCDNKIEHIIIDGQSTDETVLIIRDYMERVFGKIDVKLIVEPDEGIYDAMNKGISLSTGDVVSILNSDDSLCSSSLSVVANYFIDKSLDVVHGDIIWCYKYENFPDLYLYKSGCENLQLLNEGMTVNHPSLYCRRDVYQRIGLFDSSLKYVADWKWMLLLREELFSIKYIKTPLCVFDMGGVSNKVLFSRYLEIISTVNEFSLQKNCLFVFFKYFFRYLSEKCYEKLLPSRLREFISYSKKARKLKSSVSDLC